MRTLIIMFNLSKICIGTINRETIVNIVLTVNIHE